MPSERAGHQAPAGGIDTDEERAAPEPEAMEPVEAEAAEPVDAEPGKPGPTPSGAAPSADMADADVAHTDVADADMAAADTRRGAGRGNRQRERRARGKCDHRFTQHCFLLMRTPSGRPPLTPRVDPARTRTGTAYAGCNTPAARTLRCLRSTFRERYQEQSNKCARHAPINRRS